jgi:hypothetical protein
MSSWIQSVQKAIRVARARRQSPTQQDDVSREKAKREYDAFLAYKASRDRDIDRAISRRISSGDMGLPFLLIDTVFAVSITGHQRGQASDLNQAIEDAKDDLWFQCRHLGGDAVLHANFHIKRGIASFTNGVGVAWNVMTSIAHATSRNGSMLRPISAQDTQATFSVFAQGSAVRLLPHDTKLSPEVYAQFDKRWLNMALPPGVSEPPSPIPAPSPALHRQAPHYQPAPTRGPSHADHDPDFEAHVRAARQG